MKGSNMRKTTILLIIFMLIMTCGLAGCKKKSTETETTKVPEQYQKQAEEEITEENMDEELENIEQELEAETGEQ